MTTGWHNHQWVLETPKTYDVICERPLSKGQRSIFNFKLLSEKHTLDTINISIRKLESRYHIIVYYFFLHLLLQLAVHALNARVWNCLWFIVQIIVFLCRCPPTWVGQASMQLSRDPAGHDPDPPEPPRAYIILLVVVLLVVVLLVVLLVVTPKGNFQKSCITIFLLNCSYLHHS